MSCVLIVEDEDVLLDTLQDVLELEGFQTAVARNGQEGLQKIRELKPSLVLLDLMMPGVDGYEVLRQLPEIDGASNIPVIVISSGDAPQGGFVSYLRKPFTLNKLLAAIHSAIGPAERKPL